MTSNDVLAVYENIAGLTNQMVVAARGSDWDGLSKLEGQCATEASAVAGGAVPALSGAPRMRKIDLLRQILANDREIRNVTEPWMAQLAKVMPEARL
ncbi:flagellar protein FliT [Janthinobacterium agaricidamnosum]|uniref:Flagellar protein FliT n=1 Tax=Janthinobacterium agaricidamnosum NBRC 102515 = DSM 9628 TaxID=1349767 RepID=W0VA16_9BURK|nr:flagellar protein FliT [Janthinobacterium agaricidamnosum]CDG84736.1 fliT flagellar protein [Janthinobacterium agaricidamnosum NBRC 102515 = DSM 9628]